MPKESLSPLRSRPPLLPENAAIGFTVDLTAAGRAWPPVAHSCRHSPATMIETAPLLEPSRWSRSLAKRLFDIACVAPALLFLLPAILAIAIAVRLSSMGPAIFRQERSGLGRSTFTLYKFRTMRTHIGGPSVTQAGDPRLTRLGMFLRRCKLDEIPQLYNVLRGDMSLVGPRPKLPKFESMGMACRPGITGAATVAFADEEKMLRNIPPERLDEFHLRVLTPAKRTLDEEYGHQATFFTDLDLLIRTVCGLASHRRFGPAPHANPDVADPLQWECRRESAVSCPDQTAWDHAAGNM